MTSFTRSSSTRAFGFDILRIISMLAIVTFHVNEAVFWQDLNPIDISLHVYRFFEVICQHLTFSGFTIIALSFFLMGKGSRKNYLPLFGFLALGVLVLASFQEDPPFTGFYFEWDIYSFLLVSILFVQLLVFIPRWYGIVAGLAFLATWIPVWRLLPNSPDFISQALVGICPPQGVGSWPLMPWLSWPILFFCLGGLYRQSANFRHWLSQIHLKEMVIWISLLLISIPFYGAFNWVPIGPHFYCHTLRQEPYLFWATMVWIIFFMRISMVDKVNQWLSGQKWAQVIADLRWNRKFGVTYLVHLPLLGLGIYMRNLFVTEPWLFDLYYVSVLPGAELLVRFGEKILIMRRHNRVRAKD
jgi:hypothetical protein